MERTTQNRDSNILQLDSPLHPWYASHRQLPPASLWWKLALPDASLRQEEAKLAHQAHELERRNQELQLLSEAIQALHAASDADQVLGVALDYVQRLFDVASCAVWLVEEGRDELICRAVSDPLGQILPQQRLQVGQGVAGKVVESGESCARRTIGSLGRWDSDSERSSALNSDVLLLQSVACAPLMLQDRALGALEVTTASGVPFTSCQLTLLQSMATAVAVAIDQAHSCAEVQRQKSELVIQNEDLEAFAHTVAHDLKGSINLVTGFAYLLKEKHATFSSQELEICVDALARGGYRLGNIIDELLLLAEVRRRAFQRSGFSMAAVVAEAQHRLSSLIHEYQAQIACPATWPDVIGHPPWVEEVWVNYISNAIKYGGNPPQVQLGASRMGEEVRFWVRDNGHGLTAQQQGQLFVPFIRLDQVRTKGHGLGLSIVRRIMDQLGGDVGVESRPGRGSVFYFTLPCTE